MNRAITKSLTLLLTLTLLWTGIPLTATADTEEVPAESAETVSTTAQADIILPDVVPNGGQALTEENTPPGMMTSETIEQGFTQREYGAETDLYSAVLSDGKGNYTLFYYDSPIKYVDENGVVRDKILQPMAQADGSYRTRQSDILTTFSPNLSDGITLERAGQSIRLTPLETEAQATLTADSMSVSYAVDDTTRYEYTLTPMGFKEDIIVEAYTGQTEYSFLLETDGLTLIEEYGTYHLVDEYNTVQAYLGEIILFTADDRNNTFGQMRAQTVEEGQKYLLTVELDEDWLSDPDTHYPITVDPTMNYNTSENIEDVTVDSAKTYAGDSGSLYVGRNTDGAKRRALMRFPKLNLSGCVVTSARVSIRDLMCEETTLRVECREYTGNSWSESGTTTWSSVGNSAGGSVLSYQNISYDIGNAFTEKHRYTFDITSLAKKWATGTSSPAKGIVFRTTDSHESSSSTDGRTFASINRGSNPPMLTVEYTYDYSIKLNYENIAVDENDSFTLNATTTPAGLPVSWSVKENTGTEEGNTGTGIEEEYTGIKVKITLSGNTCKITAKNLGPVIVIATISDPTGKIIEAKCSVYIRMIDGVYKLQTTGSHLFATTNGIRKYRENKLESDIFQNTQNLSDRGQYWRFCYLRDGKYTIRSLTDSKLALYANSDGSVMLKQIGTSDSVTAVPTNAQWEIDVLSGYYHSIRSCAYTKKVLASPPGDINNGTALYLDDYNGQSYQSWFHPIKVANPPSGMSLYYFENSYVRELVNNNIMSVNISSSKQLYAAFYSGGVIQQDYSWKISGTSASVNSNGVVHAFDRGTSTLSVTNKGIRPEITITITISTNQIYGDRDYNEIKNNSSIKCHAYAMDLPDEIEEWCPNFMEYSSFLENNITSENAIKYDMRNTLSEKAKIDFEKWLNDYGYTWEQELSFTGNGSNRIIAKNQYRVVLRTGVHFYNESNSAVCDYHFWYQTYTGNWAHKPSIFDSELLPNGTTPYADDSSGWYIYFINKRTQEKIHKEAFYDGPLYVYIINQKQN